MDNTYIQGLRVVISGGNGGAGQAVAELLAARGARVFIFGRRSDQVDEVVAAIRQTGGVAFGGAADVTNQAGIEHIFAQAVERLGGIDALVNNAALPADNIMNTPVSEWEHIVNVNLVGYMRCARSAILQMQKQQQGGRIINIGSLCIRVKDNGCDIYVATKLGVAGFTDSLRKEVAPNDIAVTLINPGQIASQMVTETEAEKADAVAQEQMLLPTDVAETVALCLALPHRVVVTELEVRPRAQVGL